MELINGWRFPNNNYGPENGLDTSDLETFKKDPDAALSREICQNSIDAKVNKSIPVRIDFKLFETKRENIPGIDDLTNQIEKCYEYKKDSLKEYKSLKIIKDSIQSSIIKCLRISDFNTSGLIGVSTNEKDKSFYNLTKGAGISNKVGTNGGSKGIGKFASFVASTTNTIFYSTNTIEKEQGYIGISKLRSVPINANDPNLMTTGTGYYARNEKNEPILEPLFLDKSFQRQKNEYGTDVFLIGFNDHKNWKTDIITKVLDSFMVAIMNKELEIIVDNIIIDNITIEEIIYNNVYISKRKTEKKNIIAQYELLKEGNNVFKKDFLIDKKNLITLYIKKYSQEEEHQATKKCIMIRYPHMKIKHLTQTMYLPFSAMCIIHDNILNEKLRNIENPQHTDWELKRLNDYPKEKQETRSLIKEMEEIIKNFIREILIQAQGERVDFEGAGKYLPFQDDNNLGNSLNEVKQDYLVPSSIKRVSKLKTKTKKSKNKGVSLDFDNGDNNGEEEGIIQNNNKTNEDKTTSKQNTDEYQSKPNIDNEGNKRVLKKTELVGMNYRNIAVDKKLGRYDILFTSTHNENNCEIEIKMIGERNDKYPIEIISAMINNKSCVISNGKIINLQLNNQQKYKVECILNEKKLFASEVSIYAYR